MVRPQGQLEEEEEVEVEEAEEAEEVEEEDQSNQPQHNQPLPPMEMGNWKAKNPPSSLAIEQKPTSSCTNSDSTNSSIQTPRL